MKKIKRWRVYQTISILVDAENEIEAREKALSDESNLDGWNKWDVELDCQYVDNSKLENEADKDDRLYHEEQDHKAMEKATVQYPCSECGDVVICSCCQEEGDICGVCGTEEDAKEL